MEHRRLYSIICFFLLCPFSAAGMIPAREFFLSLCKQITRIRGNMISIFLCLYLHYRGSCWSTNEAQRQVES